MLKQSRLDRTLTKSVEPETPIATQLTPDKLRRGLQLVLTLDNRIMSESMLKESWSLPNLAPAPTRLKATTRQDIDRWQGPIKFKWLI